MVTKKMLTFLVVIFSLLFFFVTLANASSWHICTVDETGAAYGTLYINLTDAENDPPLFQTNFIAHPDAQNRMLATALTAISLNKQVRVKLEDTVKNSIIEAMFLAN